MYAANLQWVPVPSHPLTYLDRRTLKKERSKEKKEIKFTQIQRIPRKRGYKKKCVFISWIVPFYKKYTYGVINDISELDPLPGLVGLIKVASMRVQPSPLNPQHSGRNN